MFEQLFENTLAIDLNEDFASPTLRKVLGQKTGSWDRRSTAQAMSQGDRGRGAYPLAFDQIPEDAIQTVSPEEALKLSKSNPEDLILWLVTTKKDSKDYPNLLKKYDSIYPDAILAVTRGNVVDKQYASFTAVEKVRTPSPLRLAKIADSAVVISKAVQDEYSTSQTKKDRKAAKSGATAMMDPKEIKKENMRRYQELLQVKHADADIKSDMRYINDKVAELIDIAMDQNTFDDYGSNLLIPGVTDKHDRPLRLNQLKNFVQDVWTNLDHYMRNMRSEKEYGRPSSYYKEQADSLRLALVKAKQQLEQGKLDTW